MIYVLLMGIALSLGLVIGSYNEGKKSCANSYEAKILKAQLKNAEIALAYYKSANEAAKIISEEAKKEADKADVKAKQLEEKLSKAATGPDKCVPVEFLRDLTNLQQ